MKPLFKIAVFATMLSAPALNLSQAEQHQAPSPEPQATSKTFHDGRLNGLRWNGLRWNGLRWNGFRWNSENDARSKPMPPARPGPSDTVPLSRMAGRPLGQ